MATLYDPPDWIADAIFYQIFPDRFCRGRTSAARQGLQDWHAPPTLQAYKGGNLLGVIERLGYLQDLGVTAIYLNPVFSSTANHRYHTHSYELIDPLLGGLETFRSLLKQAHDLGIRVIIDGVFNHCGRAFLQFADTVENGPASPWAGWFRISDWPVNAYDATQPAHYACWADNRALPVFDHHNPEVREYLLGVVEYWTRLGIDGWRLDVPDGINCPHFWEDFRKAVRKINPDAYLVGEIIHFADKWTDGTSFDGLTNYQVYVPTMLFVGGKHLDYTHLQIEKIDFPPSFDGIQYLAHLDKTWASCRPSTSLSHLVFIDNHDNARFSTIMGENPRLTELGVVLLFTLPGVPCVYYGSEVGLQGGLDPDCRRGFPEESAWNLRVLETYKKLIALRKRHIALRLGGFAPQFASADCIAFVRSFSTDRILVAINRGDCDATLTVDVERLDSATGPAEILHGEGRVVLDAAAAGPRLSIHLNAQSALVFALA